MKLHPGIRIILTTTAMAMGLSSCALKDGRLDFTWWQDAAAPVLEDDVIIEAGGGGYYRSTPAPAQIPQASIPREEPDQPAAPQAAGEQAVAQHQPTTQPPPARPVTRPAAAPAEPGFYVVQPGDTLTAIARRHGGTLVLDSAVGKGTTATVSLRCVKPQSITLSDMHKSYEAKGSLFFAPDGYNHALTQLADALPFRAFDPRHLE